MGTRKAERSDGKGIETMTNSLESEDLSNPQTATGDMSSWLKVGVMAAATALAGGLAVAWWYRNTVKRLHQADEISTNTHFGMPGNEKDD
jgi:hypothetical protein